MDTNIIFSLDMEDLRTIKYIVSRLKDHFDYKYYKPVFEVVARGARCFAIVTTEGALPSKDCDSMHWLATGIHDGIHGIKIFDY